MNPKTNDVLPSTKRNSPEPSTSFDLSCKLQTWKCKTCFEPFKSLRDCLQHEATHSENANVNPSEKKRYRCRTIKPLGLINETTESKEFREKVEKRLLEVPKEFIFNEIQKLFQPNPYHLQFICERIKADLENDVNKLKQFEILQFGSTVSGLSLIDSDIDICLYPKGDLLLEEPNKVFCIVKEYLQTSQNFKIIIAVRRAYVPIFKCIHNETGYHLDVNTSSRFGIYNSVFFSNLFRFDPVVYKLALILRIWSKQMEIVKCGRMTNYCLVWLLIFYLQNTSPPILPSVHIMQKSDKTLIVDDVNFTFNRKYIQSSKNGTEFVKLLAGFFLFYMKFNFNSSIICPYLGVSVSREQFEKTLKMPFKEYEEQLQAFKESPILTKHTVHSTQHLNASTCVVVEDPFILNRNIALNITYGFLKYFKYRLEVAYVIFTNDTIVDNIKYLQLFYKYNFVEAPRPLRNSDSLIFKLTSLHSELYCVRCFLSGKYPERTFQPFLIRQIWTNFIFEFIINIFKDIYLFKIEHSDTIASSYLGNNMEIYLKQQFEISGKINLWEYRKCIYTNVRTDYLKHQIELSNQLARERVLIPKFSTNIKFHLTITSQSKFNDIIITMDNLETNRKSQYDIKKLFNHFTTLIRSLLLSYFYRILNDNRIAYK